MFHFGEQWTWLVVGVWLTVAEVIVLLAGAAFVEWSEQRTHRHRA